MTAMNRVIGAPGGWRDDEVDEHMLNLHKGFARLEEKIDNVADAFVKIEKTMERHAEKIGELDRGNEIQKRLNIEFKHYMEHDLPVTAWEGQRAVGLVKWAAVILGTTLVNQLPKIIDLLK